MKTINRQDHLKKINAFQKVDRAEQRKPRSGICTEKGGFTGASPHCPTQTCPCAYQVRAVSLSSATNHSDAET